MEFVVFRLDTIPEFAPERAFTEPESVLRSFERVETVPESTFIAHVVVARIDPRFTRVFPCAVTVPESVLTVLERLERFVFVVARVPERTVRVELIPVTTHESVAKFPLNVPISALRVVILALCDERIPESVAIFHAMVARVPVALESPEKSVEIFPFAPVSPLFIVATAPERVVTVFERKFRLPETELIVPERELISETKAESDPEKLRILPETVLSVLPIVATTPESVVKLFVRLPIDPESAF